MRYVLFVLAFLPLFFVSAYGEELSITELNQYIYSDGYAGFTETIKIDEDTLLVAYKENGLSQGFLRTLDISKFATILEKDSIVFSDESTTYHTLFEIDSDTYGLLYNENISGLGDHVYIDTFDVTDDGIITPKTSFEMASSTDSLFQVSYRSISQFDSDTFVIAYTETDEHPDWRHTIGVYDISSDGMTISEISKTVLKNERTWHHELTKISSNVFAVGYAQEDTGGFLDTFSVSSDGLTITPINSEQFSTLNTRGHVLIPLDLDTFAFATSEYPIGGNYEGYLRVYDISPDGVTINLKNTLLHGPDGAGGHALFFKNTIQDIFVLSHWQNGYNDATLKIFTILESGDITELDTLMYEPNYSQNAPLEIFHDNIVAVAYDWRPSGAQHGGVTTFVINGLEPESNDDVLVQLSEISSQISSLTDLVIQNIADITDLQTQIDDLPTQGDIEDPLLPPEIMTLYSTNGTNFLYSANGTSNLYMCTIIE